MARLTETLGDVADFVCVDAPHAARGPPTDDNPFPPPHYEWWDAVRGADGVLAYHGVEETLAAVRGALAAAPGFDGVLGFSQGSILGAAVLRMLADKCAGGRGGGGRGRRRGRSPADALPAPPGSPPGPPSLPRRPPSPPPGLAFSSAASCPARRPSPGAAGGRSRPPPCTSSGAATRPPPSPARWPPRAWTRSSSSTSAGTSFRGWPGRARPRCARFSIRARPTRWRRRGSDEAGERRRGLVVWFMVARTTVETAERGVAREGGGEPAGTPPPPSPPPRPITPRSG